MTPPLVARQSRRLLWHGAFVLLLGLLTGFLLPVIKNRQVGLLSHFEGILSGIVLMVLGLVWPRLRLPPGAFWAAYLLALYGAYMSWATTLFSAWYGVGRSLPMTAGLEKGTLWQERFVKGGLLSFTFSMVCVCWIILWGFRGPPVEQEPSRTTP